MRNKREGREKDGKRGIEMKNAWEGRDGRERREGGGKDGKGGMEMKDAWEGWEREEKGEREGERWRREGGEEVGGGVHLLTGA